MFCFFKFQLRNSKASHLCLDQGVKENHTAILHPCHGWGPQVKHFMQSAQPVSKCSSALVKEKLSFVLV